MLGHYTTGPSCCLQPVTGWATKGTIPGGGSFFEIEWRATLSAGVPGLEPRTTEPESAVLPITPYPKGVSLPLRAVARAGGEPSGNTTHPRVPTQIRGSGQRGPQRPQARQGRVLAEDLHRLEERRADLLPRDGLSVVDLLNDLLCFAASWSNIVVISSHS